jgi:DNA-binding XRE family transcriptional regulator
MDVKNPYVRLRELCGTSQKGFATKHGFGKMTMVYLESGMYTRVSDRQSIALGRECNEKGVDAHEILREEYGATSLNEAYLGWRSEDRKVRAPSVLAKASPPFVGSDDVSPVAEFVKDTAGSLQGFCKLLKIPSITMTRYIRGETSTVPDALWSALEDVKYPHAVALADAQLGWLEGRAL